MSSLELVAVALDVANEFVAKHHRHHYEVVGHKFSLGCLKDGELVGVAIVGRPVARMVNSNEVVEVTRLCTDGTKNACSFLYGACARAAKALGYKKVQTYVLDTENATSLKASNWKYEALTAGGVWTHTDGKPRRNDQPQVPKQRWSRDLFGDG